MKAASRIVVAVALALAALAASAEEPRACLPEDLRLRLAWSKPERIAEALTRVDGERTRAGRRAVLAQRFRDAGCAAVEEQLGPGLAEPNLICRIPGRTPAVIAIGTGPQLDGWVSAALLPEIARSVASAPRDHGYLIAVLSRTSDEKPNGAALLADSLRSDPPRLFLHVSLDGARLPSIGPEADAEQRCIAQSVARSLGLSVEVRARWPDVSPACTALTERSRAGSSLGGTNNVLSCDPVPLGFFFDFQPFLRRGIPVVTWSSLDESAPRARRRNPAALLASYRLVAAHAVALDRALVEVAPAPATAP